VEALLEVIGAGRPPDGDLDFAQKGTTNNTNWTNKDKDQKTSG
jgi:hypothetical protein